MELRPLYKHIATALSRAAWFFRKRTLECEGDLDEGVCPHRPTRSVPYDDGSNLCAFYCQSCLLDNTTLTYPDRDAGYL